MKPAGGKPRHFVGFVEGQMRSGYFKVDATKDHGTLIFPGALVGATPIIQLRSWLDHRGIFDPIIYQSAPVTIIPITEIGASA